MADKKAKKDNKNLIIGVCAALAVVVVIIVAIVLATRGTRLDDSFFVTDGTKYVATMEGDEMSFGDDDVSPVKTHVVYFYSDGKVTDMKSYYEFADEASAKKMYDAYKEYEDEEIGSYELNGKYVVLTASASQYEGMTADDAKQQVEFMKMLEEMDDAEVVEEGDTEGDAEDVDDNDVMEIIDDGDEEE